MYYIQTIASITHQDSFRKPDVSADLQVISDDSDLVSPDYKEFIPPAALRRLSPVLRIGLTASIECKNNVGRDFDAISVGTALGCLRDTEKFLTTYLTATSDFLSPTAFIQSTHNTIGGQISLGLNNHAYNMTHTQNNLSFEVALLDGMMCVDEGKTNVLVGAADEKIDFLQQLRPLLMQADHPLSSGASFFAISGDTGNATVGIQAVATNFNSTDIVKEVNDFLAKEALTINDIDVLLHGNQSFQDVSAIQIAYLPYTGLHYSASSFATHIAHDYVKNNGKNYALVVNDLCEGRLGLILLKKA